MLLKSANLKKHSDAEQNQKTNALSCIKENAFVII